MENFRAILAIVIAVLTMLGVALGGWFFIALSIWTVISAEVITFGTILGACLMIAFRSVIGIIIAAIGFVIAFLIMPKNYI